MPYVSRDAEGRIETVSLAQQEGAEWLESHDPELLHFFSENLGDDNPLSHLAKSDVDLTRVLEDLVDLLVQRGIINFTELPQAAQEKLLGRRTAREQLRKNSGNVLVDDDDILPL
jgi:hypothetical protein